ncbi:MAG: hypothetical protein PVH88_14865 [Ignavibacteria bacterium]|jgi:predicted CXXCH cytochrome family protein
MYRLIYLITITFLSTVPQNLIIAQEEDEICIECHGDRTLTAERNGKEISMWVNHKLYQNSIHAENGCVSCHMDVDPEDLPHAEELEKVQCEACHDEVYEKFEGSLHGVALQKEKKLAPTCVTCHSKHNILSSSNENSKTYVMNIPELCGSCHKEGTPVNALTTVSQSNVLENYSQSIHGDGLFRRGLIVTAVCTSCHDSHDILPHENSQSSINRKNIASTCMQCHSQIEKVHIKVIRGQLWEKKPHELPVCVDCHQPHKVRRVIYDESFPSKMCIDCHTKPDVHKIVNGERVSLQIDPDELADSAHFQNQCVKCHANVSHQKNPVCLNSGQVDCSMCHAEAVNDYNISQHGIMHAAGNTDVPYCTDCHRTHNMKKSDDHESFTFDQNIPALCGECHSETGVAGDKQKVSNYSMSIHGKGLLESGLLVTATCVDCHDNHKELPASNPLSTVHSDNIAKTCASCHFGIYEDFKKSIHSPDITDTDKDLPECNDCHFSHTIERVDTDDFRNDIYLQCGKCHEEVTESYFETFHGKVSKLGVTQSAKCYDCHGAHNILPTSNPKSNLHRNNVVETCKTCHPNSNRKFVGYLTHATHHDKDKYPYLYYTFWFMSALLIGTFSFFGIHTLLWLPRALAEKRKKKKNLNKENAEGN